jgi:tetratricopeptide (TPR) repeat protein
MNSQKDPTDAWKRAEEQMNRAIKLNPNLAAAYQAMARLHWQQAQWRRMRNQSYGVQLRRGLDMAEKAMELNPMMSEALALKGVLYLLQAKARATAEREEALGSARESLQQALSTNPLLSSEFGPYLKEANQ